MTPEETIEQYIRRELRERFNITDITKFKDSPGYDRLSFTYNGQRWHHEYFTHDDVFQFMTKTSSTLRWPFPKEMYED